MQNNPDGNLDVLFSRIRAIGNSLMAQALRFAASLSFLAISISSSIT